MGAILEHAYPSAPLKAVCPLAVICHAVFVAVLGLAQFGALPMGALLCESMTFQSPSAPSYSNVQVFGGWYQPLQLVVRPPGPQSS